MILNLVNPTISDIEYKVSKFPDGQQSLDIVRPLYLSNKIIQIKSRLNSFQDLELIICANQALRNCGCTEIWLYVPYFLGARSDRRFTGGGVNYLKQVICPIINNQEFSKVTVLDPHSDVLEACLNNFAKDSNFDLVDFALEKLNGRSAQTAIVSPDAGAMKKIFDVAKQFNITNVITATKVRDISTGNILRTELPTMDLTDIEHIIIIDDICDGGRTFIELAKVIKQQTDKPIYLIVTHGIFSGGFEKLFEYFEGIFCTNSIDNIHETSFAGEKVKQKNIF